MIRYQLGNHLGSASVELDGDGAVVSYEEYHPYGSTSYQAGRTVAEVSLKRYRYTGKERDEETGLNYHGARYYATWLGRWTAADPIELGDGIDRYAYGRENPIRLIDLEGTNAGDQNDFNPAEYDLPYEQDIRASLAEAEAAGASEEELAIYRQMLQIPVKPEEAPANDLLAFPQNRTPQENWERSVEEHRRGQQVLVELPERMRESSKRSATWMAIYTAGLVAAPFVIQGGGIAIAAATRGGQALAARALPYVLAEAETFAMAMEISPAFKAAVWTGALILGVPLPAGRGGQAPPGRSGSKGSAPNSPVSGKKKAPTANSHRFDYKKFEVPSALQKTVERVHGILDKIAASRKTTALGIVETPKGPKLIVASSDPRVPKAIRELAEKEGIIVAAGKGHAEITIIQYARGKGLRLTDLAPSRDFCLDCWIKALGIEGLKIHGNLKDRATK